MLLRWLFGGIDGYTGCFSPVSLDSQSVGSEWYRPLSKLRITRHGSRDKTSPLAKYRALCAVWKKFVLFYIGLQESASQK